MASIQIHKDETLPRFLKVKAQ